MIWPAPYTDTPTTQASVQIANQYVFKNLITHPDLVKALAVGYDVQNPLLPVRYIQARTIVQSYTQGTVNFTQYVM